MAEMSTILRNRDVQPGSYPYGRGPEAVLRNRIVPILPEGWTYEPAPKDLAKVFGSHGVVPDAKITNTLTGKFVFIEIKRQGATGNAEERSFKHYAPGLMDTINRTYDLPYYPFITVWCGMLAKLPSYAAKIGGYLSTMPDNYLLWTDCDQDILVDYFDRVMVPWLS